MALLFCFTIPLNSLENTGSSVKSFLRFILTVLQYSNHKQSVSSDHMFLELFVQWHYTHKHAISNKAEPGFPRLRFQTVKEPRSASQSFRRSIYGSCGRNFLPTISAYPPGHLGRVTAFIYSLWASISQFVYFFFPRIYSHRGDKYVH